MKQAQRRVPKVCVKLVPLGFPGEEETLSEKNSKKPLHTSFEIFGFGDFSIGIGSVMLRAKPRFAHNRRVSTITSSSGLTFEKVKIVAFVVAVFKAIGT